MPGFVDNAVNQIDDRLRELKEETSRLEAARAALTGGSPRQGRPATSARTGARSRSAGRRDRQQAT